ncbi:type VII secretion-associated serine protease mycosin [Streptomyces agglomeratus]|uniref:Type VII secretion-associated serine protease mycosin n=1 Tax=Streptomyces agglomeratus TaxID=285458 RepID=A0A1E5P596_9ACTN|nr:type VII secretion-associated serine protease mycosin [Streptomyces agglomeratus]OEJ24716.1 type VII secretion-associated serine protease mycosin [Streptomyces agglomeratus]OEJ53820.1 type VII secretion-associated serine protease mycosin [Streptomyces agglomeratus]OEJ61185.1 type VII secretion-associated serine protease mycosin [Streptomyces agglomeratus]
MGAKRVWSTAGVVALTGALLLTSAPTASADYVRDQQWVLDVFSMQDTWAESQGEGVTVAVVDSGVDATHPDLSGQVLKGKDFTGGGNAHEDTFGHGTGMASLIAARGHSAKNASGMIGLAPKAQILPLRTLQNKDDKNLDETWGAAVRYAVDQGAKVINLSFSSDGGSKTLSDGRQAIAYAQEHDVVVVAAAGNSGAVAVDEPAALPGVVSVGAVDKEGNRWEGSNTGKGLTLTAPGVEILAANKNRSPEYGLSTGTSGATAYVSATAALVRAKYPDLTAGQVINRLIKSASFLGHKGLKAPDDEYGYGIIRPYKAVTMDIPKGPKEGPLGKLQLAGASAQAGSAAGDDDSSTRAKKKSSSSSRLFLIGGIAAVVVIGGIIFAVVRSRGNRGNGGPGPGGPNGGTPPQGMGGYPNQPQYPTAQQSYPTAPPGSAPQHPNPYAQRPPHQGQ